MSESRRSPQDEDHVERMRDLAESVSERTERIHGKQGEDHEAGIEAHTRARIARWLKDAPAVTPAAFLEAFSVSPSRDGSVAVEDVAQWLREWAQRREDGARRAAVLTAAHFLAAEFSCSSADRPEQPEPDVLGGQPPTEPEEKN